MHDLSRQRDTWPRAAETGAGTWQIFDIKLLADMERTYRQHLKDQISAYRFWKRKMTRAQDMTVKLYCQTEGRLLYRQAVETAQFYWILRTDFRRVFHHYMKSMDQGRWMPRHST
ncbi:MAG: hypothetical protein J0L77_01575 [Alphaproteobacteria bacterium]|nr:hypothetical protein [Alphaproteobacteria bacterium]